MAARAYINAPIGQTPELPAPNSPCVCKSGRKAKRCCLHLYHAKRAAGLADYADRGGRPVPVVVGPPPEAKVV